MPIGYSEILHECSSLGEVPNDHARPTVAHTQNGRVHAGCDHGIEGGISMRQSGWVGDVGHDFDCAGNTKGDPLRDKTIIPGRVGFATLTVQLDAPPLRREVFDGGHQSVFVR
jgi:hypothetical protein